MAFERLRDGTVALGDVGRDSDGNGFTEEFSSRRALFQMRIQAGEETTDLWIVKLGVPDELDLSALGDSSDAAFEDRWINTKEYSCARLRSSDSGGFKEACRQERGTAGRQLSIAIAAGSAPFEEGWRAFAKDESVELEYCFGDLQYVW